MSNHVAIRLQDGGTFYADDVPEVFFGRGGPDAVTRESADGSVFVNMDRVATASITPAHQTASGNDAR